MSISTNIAQLIRENRLEEAAFELDRYLKLNPEDAEAWYLRGKVWWRKGFLSRAMTCYSRAVTLDPESPAAVALSQARDIADFYNPDLLNP